MSKRLQNFNPFPGLRNFEFDEHHLFFGRENQIDELTTRIQRAHFLAVVGASGSGKSSLIRAGMLPKLQGIASEKRQSGWRFLIFRPGNDPIGNLAAQLKTLGSSLETEELLHTDSAGLIKSMAHVLPKSGPRLLILVDQFEEIFRYKSEAGSRLSKEIANRFVQMLLAARQQQAVPIDVVLILRSDFLGECTEFEGLPEAINEAQYLIPRMSRVEKNRAITGPIGVGKAKITDRLMERLITDLGDNPDELPIMQHALMRTWDYWGTNSNPDEPIDVHHYEAIGTTRSALSIHAEEAFAELSDDRTRKNAEKIFKCLTDHGADNRGVRRPTAVKDVCEYFDFTVSDVQEVTDCFRQVDRSFLTPPAHVTLQPETVLDISHESLMRVWERFIQWVAEEAESAQIYLRLAAAAAMYQEGKAALWRDPELELALRWQEQQQPTRGWAQRYDPSFERAVVFLDHSRSERDFAVATQELRQKQELQRSRLLAAGMSLAAVFFLLGLLYTINLYTESESNKREAVRQQEKAVKQEQIAVKERERAEKETKKAVEQENIAVSERQRAETEKERAITQEKIAVSEREHARIQEKIAINERQRAEQQKENAQAQEKIAVNERLRAEKEKEKADKLSLLSLARALAFQAVRAKGSEKDDLPALLAVQAYRLNKQNNGSLYQPDIYHGLLNTSRRLKKDRPDLRINHTDNVRSLAASSKGTLIISAGEDGVLKQWQINASDAPTILMHAPQTRFRVVAISPGDQYVAAGASDGTVLIKSLANSEKEFLSVKAHTAVISGLVFLSNSQFLTTSHDSTIRVWQLPATGQMKVKNVQTFSCAGSVLCMALSSDQKTLAVGLDTNVIELHSIQSPDHNKTHRTVNARLSALEFSTDGQKLAAGFADGIIRVWEANHLDGESVMFLGHASGITDIDFNADSNLMASGSLDHTIRLWSAKSPEDEPVVLEGHDNWVLSIVFAADDLTLISGSADQTVRTWITQPDILAQQICQQVQRNLVLKEWQKYIGENIPYEASCPDYPIETNDK